MNGWMVDGMMDDGKDFKYGDKNPFVAGHA